MQFTQPILCRKLQTDPMTDSRPLYTKPIKETTFKYVQIRNQLQLYEAIQCLSYTSLLQGIILYIECTRYTPLHKHHIGLSHVFVCIWAGILSTFMLRPLTDNGIIIHKSYYVNQMYIYMLRSRQVPRH